MTITLIPLIEIDSQHDFWRGDRFRQFGMGLNVPKDEDYYEYMLADIPGDREHMLLTCVEGYKAGCALGFVKISNDDSKIVVKGKTIKEFMGTQNTFIVKMD